MKNPTKKQLLNYINARITFHENGLTEPKRFEDEKLKHIAALKELKDLKTFISGE